jgi:hypothetical protein
MKVEETIARIKARADIQMQCERLKAEGRMMEKKQEHKLRMAQLNF